MERPVTDKHTTPLERFDALRRDMCRLSGIVETIVEEVVEAVFARDADLARRVGPMDEEVDREDVRIEREAVSLMSAALTEEGAAAGFDERRVRLLLTIVKVNNEYERIADLAVDIADQIESFLTLPEPMPARCRVMANSVIGMIVSVNAAFEKMDASGARRVLASYDTTAAFQDELLRGVGQRVASGANTVEYAFAAQMVIANLARMADHCTNIAEQVIYVASGKIVRHHPHGWSEPMEPLGDR